MPPIVLMPAKLKIFFAILYVTAITIEAIVAPRKLVKNGMGWSVPLMSAPIMVLKNVTTTASYGLKITRTRTVDRFASPNLGPGINAKIGGSIKFSTMASAINIDKYKSFLSLVGD